jgi:DNA-directed RNA polymerase specialized sigma24 family protein
MSFHTVTTDAELLVRLLNPADEAAWRQFKAIYRPGILAQCRASTRPRLDEATAAGLTDAVLLKLREALPRFRYDRKRGRLRGWLWTLVNHELHSFFRRDAPKPAERPRGGSDHQEALGQLPDPNADDLNALTESVVRGLSDPRMRRMMLVREAVESVKERLRNPKRWEAFWAIKVDGQRPTDVAEDLGMTPAAVAVAVADLDRMLRKELERRLNRLLAAAAGSPDEGLARYAGRTVEQLRGEGVRLAGPLRAELEALLDGLTAAGVEGKNGSSIARALKMRPGELGQAADRFARCVEEEANRLESDEAAPEAGANL